MKSLVKTMFLALVALGVGFGGEFEDCVNACKAKRTGDALAVFECPNEVCAHLKTFPSPKIEGGDGRDTLDLETIKNRHHPPHDTE